MSDDKDSEFISWAREFDVTIAQVHAAVAAVGPRKADVEMYLKGSHASTDSDTVRHSDQ